MMTVVTSAEFGRRTQVSFPSASSVSEKSSHEKVSSEIQDRLGAILLIEDDALLQTFIKTILAGEGYELIVAEDGEHAMEAATRHHGRISLLITDLRLPGTSGDEVANHFWKIYPGLPVLYISGQLEQNCHLKNFSRYVTSFLQKPFQVKDLISRVEELLDRPAKAS